jgi:WD40 repeat protein/serine/threonine protein kinase
VNASRTGSGGSGHGSPADGGLAALVAALRRERSLLPLPEDGTEQLGRQLGDFRLVRPLGRGGMGTVWEAEQASLGRRVAVKTLASHLGLSENAVERFHREAGAGGRLQHDGIVGIFEIGEADGTHYMAQELVAGGMTLAHVLAFVRESGEVPSDYYPALAEWFTRIADAMQVAHDAGVVHRDLKPANILISEQGEPKVGDFGLALVNDDLVLSRTGELAGTPFYMSPEQAMGKRIGIDDRTDLFSLGATLYEALTLRRPFEGDTSQQVLEKIMMEDPPDPRVVRGRVPEDLAVICMKALEKQRERRYATMVDFADDLRRQLADEPILARPPGPLTRTLKWTRRHPVRSVAAALIVGALAIVTVLLVELQDRSDALATSLGLESALRMDLATALASESELSKQKQDALVLERRARIRYHALFLLAKASSLVDSDPDLALLLAIEGAGHEPGPLANTVLLDAVRTQPGGHALTGNDGEVLSVEASRDGRQIVSVSGHLARLWDSDGTLQHVLEGHADVVRRARFSAQGRHVVTASDDGSARVWETATGALVQTLPVGARLIEASIAAGGKPTISKVADGLITAVSIDPPGETVLTVCNRQAQVWDVAAAALRVSIGGLPSGEIHHGDEGDLVIRAEMSPDGRWIAVCGQHAGAGWVGLLELEHAERGVRHLEAHDRLVESVHFTGDGLRLLSVGGFRSRSEQLHTAYLWDVMTGDRQARFDHAEEITAAAISLDGNTVATASERGAIAWKATGEQVQRFPAGVGQVSSLGLSADGSVLVAGSADGSVQSWSIPGGEPAAQPVTHLRPVTDVTVSPDGSYVCSASRDGTARIVSTLELPGARSFHGHAGPVGTAAFSPDGKRLVTGSGDGTAIIWNVTSARPLTTIENESSVVSVSFSPDGASVMTGGGVSDSTVRVWDAQTGELRCELLAPIMRGFGVPNHVAFSPDGSTILSADILGTQATQLWDASTGRRLVRMDPAAPLNPEANLGIAVNTARFHPDGRLIVSTRWDPVVRIWSAQDGELLEELYGHSREVAYAEYNHAGDLLASVDIGGQFIVWDGETVEGLQMFEARVVTSFAFRPLSDELLVPLDDNDVGIWDARSGQRVGTLTGHGGPVTAFSCNTDGSLVLTASRFDRSVRVWDAAERSELLRLRPHEGRLAAAVFSPDGRSFVTTGEDMLANLWPTDVLSLAQSIRPRGFTPEERQLYGLEPAQ